MMLVRCLFECRVYDNDTLRQVWQVGPLPMGKNTNPDSSTLYALGESVVAFDIAPPISAGDTLLNGVSNSAVESTRKSVGFLAKELPNQV